MPSSQRNLKAAAWDWRSAVPSWNRMGVACGPHPTTDEVRRFISLCQPQSRKCLLQYDSEFNCQTLLWYVELPAGKLLSETSYRLYLHHCLIRVSADLIVGR